VLVLVVLTSLALAGAASADPTPTFALEQRVEAQRAVDRVYWAHRTWTSSDRGGKPAFELAVPPSVSASRAEDALRKTHALRELWQQEITAEELRAEVARMARDTQAPATLRELWKALGNDPLRVAEILARPIVAERKLRAMYARDPRLHAATRAAAEASWPDAARVRRIALDRDRGAGVGAASARASGGPAIASAPRGRWSALNEDESSLFRWRVVADDRGAPQLEVASWPKLAFDRWWPSARSRFPVDPGIARAAAAASLPELSDPACTPDTWSRMDPDLPLARSDHTAVWTGSEMIIWGGNAGSPLQDGWRYDPTTDVWTPTSTVGAPAARHAHVAAWTGSRMIVWGGFGTGPTPVGGMYDPASDSWTPMSTTGQPFDRVYASSVWTGSQLLVWGGIAVPSGTMLDDGRRYDPATNTWSPMKHVGAPTARLFPSVVWTGNGLGAAPGQMIVWGGQGENGTALGDGRRYLPSVDGWIALSPSAAPAPRAAHRAVWTGTEMVVWGGIGAGQNLLDSGGRYRPDQDTWQPLTTRGAPTGRIAFSAVWSGARVVIWGGDDGTLAFPAGARYDPAADAWDAMSSAGSPGWSSGHTAVSGDGRIIVWGGWSGPSRVNHGGHYDPIADAWTPMSIPFRPAARHDHAAVWTGAEMIVWGGNPGGINGYALDAGRYDPALDSWSPISASGAPTDRWSPGAAWTGREMLIWGGAEFDPSSGDKLPTDGGGAYDPATDRWRPLPTLDQPSPRMSFASVWTGEEMIVLGGCHGEPCSGAGGRYRPTSDSWTAVPFEDVEQRKGLSAVWTGVDVILFGGAKSAASLGSGYRYDPVAPEQPWTSIPPSTPRQRHSAVWSGGEMLVWGGGASPYTGDRFDPQLQQWTPIAAPPASIENWQSAVWSCARMVVHGEEHSDGLSRTALYDPASGSWAEATRVGQPIGASYSRPVADDTGMITFGGAGYEASYDTTDGARYCVCTAQATFYPYLFIRRTAAGARLVWYVNPEASGYDLVRGSVLDLLASRGDFSVASEACLLDDSMMSGVDDPQLPGSGDGYWYLVRAIQQGAPRTYDSGSASQAGTRDPEIAICP